MAARLTAYVVVAIVAATLIAGLIVGAQRDDNDGPVDLIVRNATVYTAGGNRDTAEAVAVRGNQILRVGSNREIARFQRPQTIVVDARGGAVVPGFNDAGLRLAHGASELALAGVDLSEAASTGEVLERIRARGAGTSPGAWVVGHGWSAAQFRGDPSKELLDSAVPDRPAVIFGTDRSTAWVNSRALTLAGITRRTPDPADGAIVRDPRTGEPEGVLHGAAAALVAKLVPAPTREQRAAAVRAAIAEANSLGITSLQTVGELADTFEIFDQIRRSGDLTLRIYSAIPVRQPLTESKLAELAKIRTKYPDDPLLKSGALSIQLDGPVQSGAAALLDPYTDPTASNTPASFDPDALNRTVRLADAANWQIMAHAHGDRAVRMALNAYAHAVRSNRPPARGRRHRIEDVVLVDATDLPRFDLLGVVASMRPVLGSPTDDSIEAIEEKIGADRAARAFAFRSLGEATRLIFGSGWPDGALDPLLGVHVATTQTTVAGTPEDGWHPEERLELESAVDAYTSRAAWASFDDQRKGSIEAGMLADLVVLTEDIFAAPDKIASASVAVTIFDGKIVYQRVPRTETAPAPAAVTQ